MKIFRKNKTSKETKIEKQQEIVQEVVEKAEEEFKAIKEKSNADEENIRQKAIEQTAKRILQIFKESPRYREYVQDIARGLAEESELPTDVVVEMIKGTIEQEELPNNIAEKMAQILPDDQILSAIESDNKLNLKHKEVLATGIGNKETRIEVEKDIKTQREQAEEKRIINALKRIYEECDEIPEAILVDKIDDLSIKEKTSTINKMLDKIVAKKIADNYYKFGGTSLETLEKIVSVEDMYEYDIPSQIEEECNKRTKQGMVNKKYNKENFENILLTYMAKDIAERFFKTGKYIIPQIQRFKTLDIKDKKFFKDQVEKATVKRLTKMQDSDIEAQMLGIIGVNSEVDKLGERLSFDIPKTKAKKIIEIALKMTEDDDRYYNTIMYLKETGTLEMLAEMQKDKREKYIRPFARFLKEKKKQNEKENNIERKEETPDSHGEEDR